MSPTAATIQDPLGRQARRQLADNVICMFDDERSPIANPARQGRLPRGVPSLRSRSRLNVGDIAEICTAANGGVWVRLLEQYSDGDWSVESLQGPIRLQDGKSSRGASASPDQLRRVSNGRRRAEGKRQP